MSALAPNPQTSSGIGGASTALAPTIEGWLPGGPPAGSHVDAQYLQDDALLRAQIEQQYAPLLQQLGYTDPVSGAYIPGSVVQQANITEEQAQQGMQQADIQNTQTQQQKGTLFSGQRAVQQAQAEAPFLQTIGQTEYETPTTLAGLHSQAVALIGSYNAQNQANLAAAADRYAQTTQTNPTTPKPMQAGGEVDQPTNAIIGEAGPEAVVARKALTPEENMQLDDLQQAARSRLADASAQEAQGLDQAMPGATLHQGITGPDIFPPEVPQRPVDQGGPTDQFSVPPYQTDQYPPVHLPQRPVDWGAGPPPVHLPLLPVRHPAEALYDYGPAYHAQALNMWQAHHPYALAHPAFQPHWVHQAIAERLRYHPLPFHPVGHILPPIHVLPPGPPIQPLGTPPPYYVD